MHQISYSVHVEHFPHVLIIRLSILHVYIYIHTPNIRPPHDKVHSKCLLITVLVCVCLKHIYFRGCHLYNKERGETQTQKGNTLGEGLKAVPVISAITKTNLELTTTLK